MKNSIKNLNDKAIKNLNTIKGGNDVDNESERPRKGGFWVQIEGIEV